MMQSKLSRSALCFPALFLVLAWLSMQMAAQDAHKTWRLDYFHTGGPGLEAFSLDRVVVEPLAWPGHPSGNIEPRETGVYRFEIRDTSNHLLLFSRGYSSIFGEWTSTLEAGDFNRTFHESLRFPAPAGPVEVVINKRDPKGIFHQVWRTVVDPKSIFIDRASPPKQAVVEIERNGDPSEKVDILLLGDGYTAKERGKFVKDAWRLTETLFRTEPFKSRRKDINVWALCPPSAESGVSRPSTGVYRTTPIGATYDVFGSERYVLTMENRAMREIACWAPYEFVEILVNNETYGGGGIYNLFSTVAAGNDWANYIFVHEFGHHMAGLADEYYTSPVAYQPPSEIVEPWEPNVTATTERGMIKWKDLIGATTPLPTPWPKEEFETFSRGIQERRRQIRAERRPESVMSALFREEQEHEMKLFGAAPFASAIGAFQGANYDAKAFYRPQVDCIMFTRNEVPFCAACNRALSEVMDWVTGKKAR